MRRFLLYFGPPIFWMAAIFVFSTSLFGDEQTGSFFEPLFRYIFPGISQQAVDALHFMVRKAAHMTEYAVLALLWYRALACGAGRRPDRALLLALIVSVLYAASDEFHQYFVPNRSASVIDVLVDAAGAATGLLALWLNIKGRLLSGARMVRKPG